MASLRSSGWGFRTGDDAGSSGTNPPTPPSLLPENPRFGFRWDNVPSLPSKRNLLQTLSLPRSRTRTSLVRELWGIRMTGAPALMSRLMRALWNVLSAICQKQGNTKYSKVLSRQIVMWQYPVSCCCYDVKLIPWTDWPTDRPNKHVVIIHHILLHTINLCLFQHITFNMIRGL